MGIRLDNSGGFADLLEHQGHELEIVSYGNPPINAALECIDCGEVLLDFEYDGEEEEDLIEVQGPE